MRAYIGLGSNLGDGRATILRALEILDQHDSIKLLRQSSFYGTAAWGNTDQPDFTNAVAELETDLTAEPLLIVLLNVELCMGRKRSTVRWGPRSIDIDLLCCEAYRSNSKELELPHPRMHQRAFVLIPLLELDPDVQIPGIGSAKACLDGLENQRVIRLK